MVILLITMLVITHVNLRIVVMVLLKIQMEFDLQVDLI